MKKDILICTDDRLSLPVHVCDTIEEASQWIDCSISTLYYNMSLYGVMKAKGYIIELVERKEA